MDSQLFKITVNNKMLESVADICERLGALKASMPEKRDLKLRRVNQIKSVQSSLAIEGNTLSLEQVTAVLDGKRVLGSMREVQEIRNALEVYEQIDSFPPYSLKDLCKAHKIMMRGLVDEPGKFRRGGIGIQSGEKVIFVAPPADNVNALLKDLFKYLKKSSVHPLIKSCIFHYEFEFIHPFADGNGRLGRLWQNLLLMDWQRIFVLFPIETTIRERQQEYYAALNKANNAGNSEPFVEFMLDVIKDDLYSIDTQNDLVNDPVSDSVAKLLKYLKSRPLSIKELMLKLKLSHRPTFRKNYLHKALNAGLIEMTIPEKPNSRNQKYRLTDKGNTLL